MFISAVLEKLCGCFLWLLQFDFLDRMWTWWLCFVAESVFGCIVAQQRWSTALILQHTACSVFTFWKSWHQLKGSWIGYWRPATLKKTCQRWFVVVNVENGKMPNLQLDYKNKPPVVSEHWFWFKIHFIVVFLNIYRHKMTQKNVSASSDMHQCLQL